MLNLLLKLYLAHGIAALLECFFIKIQSNLTIAFAIALPIGVALIDQFKSNFTIAFAIANELEML